MRRGWNAVRIVRGAELSLSIMTILLLAGLPQVCPTFEVNQLVSACAGTSSSGNPRNKLYVE